MDIFLLRKRAEWVSTDYRIEGIGEVAHVCQALLLMGGSSQNSGIFRR